MVMGVKACVLVSVWEAGALPANKRAYMLSTEISEARDVKSEEMMAAALVSMKRGPKVSLLKKRLKPLSSASR